ncbi:MAG: DUF3489 domain-containing protein [Rhodospirillaceae bacterium]
MSTSKARLKSHRRSKAAPKSKASICIGLLTRKEGATIADLQKATGWQSHSVRGFLSSKIKKTAGLKLTSGKKPHGVRRYHAQPI